MYLEMMECHITFRVTVTLTSDLVLRIIVFGTYLSYSLRSEFQILCVYVSWDGEVSLNIFWVTVTLTPDLVLIIIVSGAYLILFEIGIPILVCECIFGLWSVLYHLWVTVTLTSDLVFRKIMSGAYLLYY